MRRSGITILLAIAYAASFITQLSRFREQLDDLRLNPPGYGDYAWRNSSTINAILHLPEETPIIASDTAGVVLWTNRPAYDIRELIEKRKVDQYLPFGSDTTSGVENLFRDDGAALVLFRSAFWQFYDLYQEDTDARLDAMVEGLYQYRDLGDGSIYFYDRESAPDG